jgi:hypothetical protein
MLQYKVMLLVEMLLVLQEVSLPAWFLPQQTPHGLVSILHRIFPAFMNGCRCITGAFYADRKALYVQALDAIASVTKDVTLRCNGGVRLCAAVLERFRSRQGQGQPVADVEGNNLWTAADDVGVMNGALHDIRKVVACSRESRDGSLKKSMGTRLALLDNPKALAKLTDKTSERKWDLIRNLIIYVVLRYILIKPNN